MRKQVPMLITALSALVIVFSRYFFIGQEIRLDKSADRWFLVSFAFAVAVGVVNLTVIHIHSIVRRKPEWIASVFLLVSMYGYMIITLWQTVEGPLGKWIFNAMIVPAGATMYGMVVFFIYSAAFRAFRIRTLEAVVLMVSAVIVLLGSAPIGDVISPVFGQVNDWLMKVPVTSAYRGIIVGAYLGSFATALRIVLGLERAHMGA